MQRRASLLAGAVVVAGTAAMLSASGGGANLAAPKAEIAGAALSPSEPSGQTPEEVAAFQALADQPTATPAQTDSPKQIAKPIDTPVAEAAVAKALAVDLDNIERVGDHYEAPMRSGGKRAVLTLDPELQPLAEKLLDQSRAPRGAIVVMAPDGRILALAGRRTEEPKGAVKGTFDWRLATDAWAPAASVFKLVTATALFGVGVSGDTEVCYHGGLRSVTSSNLEDSKQDNRCESLAYGVAHSNNAILGKLAYQKLQPPALETAARSLGLYDALPGTELPGTAGILSLPTAHDLDFARTAAGFMNVKLSVAGGALLAATFADRGEQPTLRIVASIDGQAVATPAPKRAISAEAADEVAKMMVGTCDSGSAAKSFGRREVKVAGKTGTLARTEPFYMEHSWFVGFAPAEKPEVIVSVLLGNPESWHLRGHEAARKLIDKALKVAKTRNIDRISGARASLEGDRGKVRGQGVVE